MMLKHIGGAVDVIQLKTKTDMVKLLYIILSVLISLTAVYIMSKNKSNFRLLCGCCLGILLMFGVVYAVLSS